MNSSHDLISELQKFNHYLEKLNAINMFTTLFLIVIGLAGNMSALGVLMLSRKRLPRITGSNYLIALTLTNTLFLAVQFYMGTYNRMIFYFDHHTTSSLLDSSAVFCKSLPYLRNSARFLNATITACFSFERLLAVYRPLRARSHNPKYIFLLKIVVVVSFVVPSYSVFLAELAPMSQQADDMYKRYNLSRAFNLNSLSPALGKFSCSASRKHFEKLLVFHGLFWLLMFTAYLMVSASLLAIIIKLKNSKRGFLKVSYSSSNSNSSRHVTKTIVRKEQQMIRLSEPSAQQQPLFCDNSNDNLSTSPNGGSVCPSSFMPSPSRRSIQLANPKIHDTRILTSISLSFVLLNLPFFVAMFVMFYMSMRLGDKRRFAVTDLVDKMKIQIWMLVTDMLQLANFSLTGLLFFCSGQIFRIHAIKFLRGICF